MRTGEKSSDQIDGAADAFRDAARNDRQHDGALRDHWRTGRRTGSRKPPNLIHPIASGRRARSYTGSRQRACS